MPACARFSQNTAIPSVKRSLTALIFAPLVIMQSSWSWVQCRGHQRPVRRFLRAWHRAAVGRSVATVSWSSPKYFGPATACTCCAVTWRSSAGPAALRRPAAGPAPQLLPSSGPAREHRVELVDLEATHWVFTRASSASLTPSRAMRCHLRTQRRPRPARRSCLWRGHAARARTGCGPRPIKPLPAPALSATPVGALGQGALQPRARRSRSSTAASTVSASTSSLVGHRASASRLGAVRPGTLNASATGRPARLAP
jgi:hypothetical protein